METNVYMHNTYYRHIFQTVYFADSFFHDLLSPYNTLLQGQL